MEYLLGIERDKTLDISGLNDEQVTVVNSLVELLRKENKSHNNDWLVFELSAPVYVIIIFYISAE